MKSWGWLLIGVVWLIAVASRILTLPGRDRIMDFGKRVSKLFVFVALLALTPFVALLRICSDDGDVLFVCRDWVKACWRGIREYSSPWLFKDRQGTRYLVTSGSLARYHWLKRP